MEIKIPQYSKKKKNTEVMESVGASLVRVKRHRGKGAVRRGN